MGFVEKNLTANENIIYKGSIHWYIYVRTLFFFVLCAFCAPVSSGLVGLFFVVGVFSLIFNIMLTRSTEFVVTNRRVILKTGFISRKFTELQLNRSEGLTVEQGIMGRIFNFGSLKITTGGVAESFPYVSKPFEFKKAVNQGIENSYGAGTNSAQAAY